MVRSLPSASFTRTFGLLGLRLRSVHAPRSADLVIAVDRAPGFWLQWFAVPLFIVEMMVRLHKIVDREVVLTIVEPRTAPMICLNSIIELIGRISTMLRMLRASTPVESFCEVVRMVGIVFSLS
jgi:hypothetical protein